jgi:hypothetical protein
MQPESGVVLARPPSEAFFVFGLTKSPEMKERCDVDAIWRRWPGAELALVPTGNRNSN